MNVIVERVEWGSPEYEQTLELRDRLLRKPLGLSIQDDPTHLENGDIHIRAVADGHTAGVLLLRKLDDSRLQMKQVAVDAAVQGQSIGRRMVEFAEQTALELGFAEILLHARLSAVPFYEKLGYVKEGDLFTEVGIPHFHMIKDLF
ncbi:GNAT family N-acetyltransferase [Paenibacillus jiagnxiensis]|uniref:GNAT family N-acetyltransferase n=1 Tax=Paenibacillus jiagnxiensis TaxID=3228926 RepID=UPI00339DD62D